MLLPIKPETKDSKIFTLLNDEIDLFLKACIDAEVFGKDLFSKTLDVAIYENEPTRDKFKKLWKELIKLEVREREQIAKEFHDSKSISALFKDLESELPTFSEEIIRCFKELCTHLFKNTKSLKKIEQISGETMIEHFNRFRDLNGNICYICGTEELAPIRENVKENDQWIADYDHLLCKKTFPYFGINPENLWPTCVTCNRRVKGSKNLLFDKSDERRLCFYPSDEMVACNCISISITEDDEETPLKVEIRLVSDNADITQKLDTWNEVYGIVDRVDCHFKALKENLDQDFTSKCYKDFCDDIPKKIESYKRNLKLKPWNYWDYKLLKWINDKADESLKKGLWGIIDSYQKSSNIDDYKEVFGI